jgi:threonine dehydrogenase-like Zn-dependent dehydrogenase
MSSAPESAGRDARVFRVREPGVGEIVPLELPELGAGDVLVRTLASGVSRGTESLLFTGGVPESEYAAMRAPFQVGDLPGPVSSGYLNVGVVEVGPVHLVGRRVFSLHPHQTRYVAPASAVLPVPDGVPDRRAVLAGTLETAVNALWDAGPLVGDKVAVVGAGMVGLCVARLLAGIPGAEVLLVDVDPLRRTAAEALGVRFAEAHPEGAAADLVAAGGGLDLVVHASASGAGLQLALDLLGEEGVVVDLSWYGRREVTLALGGAFHSKRLTIRSSQVGRVGPVRAVRRTTTDRLALALRLLEDPAYDVLLTGTTPFEELPDLMPGLASGAHPAICHVITYPEGA